MKLKNVSNVSFAWGSILFGSLGANMLLEGGYLLGTVFVLLALGVLVLREILKKYGIDL